MLFVCFIPRSDTLIARKLPRIRLQLYASLAYLDDRDPNTLNLNEERLVWNDLAYGDIPQNVWIEKQGLLDRTILRAASVRARMKAAESGIGISPAPTFLANETNLIAVPSPRLPDRQTWIVFHRAARTINHHRRVRDWIRSACQVLTSNDTLGG